MNPSLRDDPLIVLGSPRGGTSVVAGMFAAHGFWVGEMADGHERRHGREYLSYENLSIKEFLKTRWKFTAGEPLQDVSRADLRARCARLVPGDALWMFKCAVEYHEIFKHWFPNMTTVLVFRDEQQAVEAVVRRRGEAEREAATRIIRQRYEFMRSIAEGGSAFCIQADDVVKGDYSRITPVLEKYGIQFRDDLAEEVIRPALWHFNPAGGA